MLKTTLVVPDIQYPYHDALAWKKLLKVAEDTQPNQVVLIGDAIDFPQVSQWSKGNAGEFTNDLQQHVDGFHREVLTPLRKIASDAKILWVEGNHDLRIKDFVKKYAAPLGVLRALEVPSIFGLDDLSIEYVKGPVRVGTNTFAIHGHESGGYSPSQSAWDNKFRNRYGSERNFIFGHTHQPFVIHRAFGYEGKVSPRFTMNVGSIMDPVAATYVKDGAVSWVMSFGVLRDDGKRVYPELVTMTDRGFYFNGRKY